MSTTPDHTGVVYLLVENTSAGRNTIGVFATLRDLDAWRAANPEPPDAIRESHAVAMYGDVRRMAGPQRGKEQA